MEVWCPSCLPACLLACLVQVYQGLLNGITPVAVKILHREAQRDALADLQNEVDILKACQHPSIVQVMRDR